MEAVVYCKKCADCCYSVPLVRMHQAFDGEETTYVCLVDKDSPYGDGVAVEVMADDVCERHITADEALDMWEEHDEQ